MNQRLIHTNLYWLLWPPVILVKTEGYVSWKRLGKEVLTILSLICSSFISQIPPVTSNQWLTFQTRLFTTTGVYWTLIRSACIALSYARVCNKSASVPVKERARVLITALSKLGLLQWLVLLVWGGIQAWRDCRKLLRDLWSGLNCWNLLVALVLIIVACCTPRILASIATYFYIPDIAILMKTDSWADLCAVSTIFPCTRQRPVVLISHLHTF